MPALQKITTNLWFNSQAEEAAAFYTSIFPNSSIGRSTRFGEEGFEIHGKPAGTVMTVEFALDGQEFVALNGGPQFQFTEAVSFIVNCESQEDVDYYWDKLSQGGDPQAQQCGWLKDKFGVSWQIVPTVLVPMITDPDNEKSQRVMRALFPMKKIDIATLERAYQGR
jgi:predicted 3-demethylubiquinone-9 3-methyltransferase (glyoxalase superfamily)